MAKNCTASLVILSEAKETISGMAPFAPLRATP